MQDKDILQEGQVGQFWLMVKQRLEQRVDQEQRQALLHLDKGELEKAHKCLGKIEAVKWVIGLPRQMSKELGTLQEKE